jgi:predicted glycogen debranching enzyme
MSVRRAFPFAEFNPNKLGQLKMKEIEWIIPNRLGGYSSSTITGLNTSRFHGLLVSGCKDLKRMLYLQKLDEEVLFSDSAMGLSTNEYPAGEISEGYKHQTGFEYNYDVVSFYYNAHGVHISKQIIPSAERNSITVYYKVANNTDKDITFSVRPLFNSREDHAIISGPDAGFSTKIFSDNIAGVSSRSGYTAMKADAGRFAETPAPEAWHKLYYSKDCIEEFTYSPMCLNLSVSGKMTEELTLHAVAYPTEAETAGVLGELLSGRRMKSRIISGGKGVSIFSLLNTADTFIVDVDSKKTIIAGYPDLSERGRDAMISLPGLALVSGRHREAEKILERFLNSLTRKGVPSSFSSGKPEYADIDTGLWAIDRIYQYMKYVGVAEGKKFLHTYWWALKDMVKNYGEMDKDGVLVHEGGTWMIGKPRKNAVEVQGLWYNTLKIMEYFATLMGDDESAFFASLSKRVEAAFMEKYWNGAHLSDSLDDASLRPNQLILLSLDYCLVDDSRAKKIMEAVERELLTPFGLRTRSPSDPMFNPLSRYDGGVWPHLFGAYVRAHIRLFENRLKAKSFLEAIIEQHIYDAGIGTVSEYFTGTMPYTPAGSISYACSVAEILRCYFEDILQKKPSNERNLFVRS